MDRCELPSFELPEVQVKQPQGIARDRIQQLLKSERVKKNIGGDPVSASSTQYALSFAIAVGVEAATVCSARIARRARQVFKNHKTLHMRPASFLARREFW